MIYNSKSCSLSSSTFGSSLFITKPHKYCGIFSGFRGGSVLWSLTPLFSCIGEWLLYVMSPPVCTRRVLSPFLSIPFLVGNMIDNGVTKTGRTGACGINKHTHRPLYEHELVEEQLLPLLLLLYYVGTTLDRVGVNAQ